MKRYLTFAIFFLYAMSLASCGILQEISATHLPSISVNPQSEVMLVIPPIDEPPIETEADATEAKSDATLDAEMIENVEHEIPRVYLTFDDGPGKYTESILATLAEYDVKATFFVVGDYVDRFPDRVKAVADGGHAIGCHSVTHDYKKLYASKEALDADLTAWEACMEAALGSLPEEKLYRFPGGSNTAYIRDLTPLYDVVSDRGYRCFDWTFANNDRWLVDKPEEMDTIEYMKDSVKRTFARCRGARIMLMHDTSGETAEMLGWIIEYLRGEGYEFATLADFDGECLF